ncbi:hypothetical protein [Endozoicomonas elysicola]|uniref:hypothetical protein n=1 Tax=Endozoicomonas elysicola TaxID=305900 RepID=UPI0012695AB5|nr:hypothetical protein [Endozoicomonas elysicola]
MKVIKQYIQHLKEGIVDRNEEQLALACLNKGFHYPNQYLEFLEELQSTNPLLDKTLSLLRKKQAFSEGYPPTLKSKAESQRTLMVLQKDIDRFSREAKARPFCYVRPPNSQLTPSETLLKLPEALCFFDCGQAINYSAYRAVLDVVGDKRFDEILRQVKFRISANLNNKNDYITLLFEFPSIKRSEPLVSGHCYSFRNHPFYQYKDPYGPMAAWNVVYSGEAQGEKTFIGFGLPVPCSEEHIHKVMVNACNSSPYNERYFLPEHRESIKQNVARLRASHVKQYDLSKTVTMEEFNAHTETGLDYDISAELTLEHLQHISLLSRASYFNQQIETGKWQIQRPRIVE